MRNWLWAAVMLAAILIPMSAVYAHDGDKQSKETKSATATRHDSTRTPQAKPLGFLSGLRLHHTSPLSSASQQGEHHAPPLSDKFDTVHGAPSFHQENTDHGGTLGQFEHHVVGPHYEAPVNEHGHGNWNHPYSHDVIVEHAPEHVWIESRHAWVQPYHRHDEIIVVDHPYWCFHTDPVIVMAAVLVTAAIVADADRPCTTCTPPADPIVIAKQRNTYFSCREECFANFKAKFLGVYGNDFAKEPAVRPAYIPKETAFNGKTVYIVYCQQYRSYGFWDPGNPNVWIAYSVWDDDTMADQLMLRNYYLYPTT